MTLTFALFPRSIGFQDLGALLAHQPGVAERAREHLIASPFGTIHAATFSLPRPVGTGIPHPPLYALANFDPGAVTGSIGAQPLGDGSSPLTFPSPNRKTKRDSLLSRRARRCRLCRRWCRSTRCPRPRRSRPAEGRSPLRSLFAI